MDVGIWFAQTLSFLHESLKIGHAPLAFKSFEHLSPSSIRQKHLFFQRHCGFLLLCGTGGVAGSTTGAAAGTGAVFFSGFNSKIKG